MPKVQPSGPKWNPDKNGLRFTFVAKDESHRFEIKPQEVSRGDVAAGFGVAGKLGNRYW